MRSGVNRSVDVLVSVSEARVGQGVIMLACAGGRGGGEGKNHRFTLSNLRQQRPGASVYVRLRDPPQLPPPPLCPAPAPHWSCQPWWTDRSVSDRRDGDFLVDLGGSSPLMSLRLIKGFIPRWRLQSDERSDWRLDSRDNWLIMGRSLFAPHPPSLSSLNMLWRWQSVHQRCCCCCVAS